jgi:hypothetical protein
MLSILIFGRVSVWLDQLPFETVGRILHIVNANMDNWKFTLQEEDDLDDTIFRHYMWTTGDFPQPLISEQSVVLVLQPPWILSAKDLHDFASCRDVSSFAFSVKNHDQ